MTGTAYHPEDIRAELRKRHGTVGAFARTRGFKPQALADWLRGRTSEPVARAVADELGLAEVQVASGKSISVDDTAAEQAVHRLNAAGR